MRTSSWIRLATSIVLGLLFTPLALAGGVRIVGPNGGASFPTIQSAVNAASDGDVLLIGAGTYTAFTIDGKDLFLTTTPGAAVQIQGSILIQNLVGKNVVLTGLSVTTTGGTALRIANSSGNVRAQNCSFKGAPSIAGVSIVASDKVVFASCTLQGGAGEFTVDQNALPGGAGVSVQASSLAVYDCQVVGGEGGWGDGGNGGDGGDGFTGGPFVLFASGSTFQGGRGGDSNDYWNTGTVPGNGGPGLRAPLGTQVDLLGNTFVGGAPGHEFHFGGIALPGAPSIIQGISHFYPATARTFTASAAASDQTNLSITVRGMPGDRVYVIASQVLTFIPYPGLLGVMLAPAFVRPQVLGVIPPSGNLVVQLPLADVPLPQAVARYSFQGLIVDSAGVALLGSPLQLALFNRASLPDCNGNGVQDFLDLIEGTAGDCNNNLQIDTCEIAGGLPDCNANLIPDVCDIASGSSQDHNTNGIPDECEQTGVTWYVNAAAAPGGNGSQAAPFQAIGQGIGAALSGDTVLVASGVYTGANNRNLDFTGRDLVVRSTGSPASCVIDCQGSGRAFNFHSGETAASRLQGFTITGGNAVPPLVAGGGGICVSSSSPTIVSCVISNCTSPGFGGGIYLWGSSSRVERCSIQGNSTTGTNSWGGGVAMFAGTPNGRTLLSRCLIEGNTSVGGGGGIVADPPSGALPSIISHCKILGNTTGGAGGGLYVLGYFSPDTVALDNCLILGNTALLGGGVSGGETALIANCTLVGNQATQEGGGVFPTGGGLSKVRDSILWGNVAPIGSQAGLRDSGTVLLVRYSNVQGGQAGVHVGSAATLNWSVGNLALDPLFTDADGPDNNSLTFGDNDYRLAALSPCIDAADNLIVEPDWLDLDGDGNTTEPVPFDYDFRARFVDVPAVPDTGNGTPPLVDMGAHERP
ncbi:MAG TPA: right-handed parallel beta-helix repeat-containing protein [Planctomycetota bacterium]|nr:right-handed parallel beta-helix repeat-containing protein [Planctomycetota bacterium]